MLENLAELLITHHVGGRWRAPLSQRLRDVRGLDGRLVGRLVEAGPADIARAVAAARAAASVLGAMSAPDRTALADRFLKEMARRAEDLIQARRLEGLPEPATGTVCAVDPGVLPPGPLVALGCVAGSPALTAGVLAAALRDGRPVLLKPAPRATIATLPLVAAAVAAGAPPGAVGLLQGGGAATGAPLLTAAGSEGVLLLGKSAPRAALRQPGLAFVGLEG